MKLKKINPGPSPFCIGYLLFLNNLRIYHFHYLQTDKVYFPLARVHTSVCVNWLKLQQLCCSASIALCKLALKCVTWISVYYCTVCSGLSEWEYNKERWDGTDWNLLPPSMPLKGNLRLVTCYLLPTADAVLSIWYLIYWQVLIWKHNWRMEFNFSMRRFGAGASTMYFMKQLFTWNP